MLNHKLEPSYGATALWPVFREMFLARAFRVGGIGAQMARLLAGSIAASLGMYGGRVGEAEPEDSPARRLRVLFIRHGESQNNVLFKVGFQHYKLNRTSDPALTAQGERQAESLAAYMKSAPPVITPLHGIIASPMLRALMTSKPLSDAVGIKPYVWTDLYEVGGVYGGLPGAEFGERGLPRKAIEAKFPGYVLPRDIRDDGWYPVERSRETRALARQRCKGVAARLKNMARKAKGDTNIAVVAHFETLDFVIRELFAQEGSSEDDSLSRRVFQHYNCGMTAVDIAPDGRVAMLFFNRTEHLPFEAVEWEKLGLV